MPNAFQVEDLDGGIALLTFDVPEKKVNTFSQPVLHELAGLLAQLEARADLKGLLLRSGKPGQFIAGADLNDLAALAYITPEQAAGALGLGHQLFGRISRLPFPTVALIDGSCLGGGTELALSMDDRLASTAPHTQIGLPEVKVGLIPGWGGTQRLPRLVGLHPAVEMITSGEPVPALKAAALGLVFDAVPAEHLVEEGKRRIAHLQETGEWKERREQLRQPLGLDQDQMMFAFAVAEGFIKSKTKGQYPAPLVALKAIREGCNLALDEGLKAEQKAVSELVGSPILGNLIAIFFMKNRLARDPGVSDPNIKPRPVTIVGVLGTGLMGSGIAAAHARSGVRTAMVDVDDARIQDGLKRASEVVASRIKIGRATPQDMANMLAMLNASTTTTLFQDADVVIEAVTENPVLKKEVYQKLRPAMRDGAILASNTSTISITKLAESAPSPERFIGMHFFNPVDRMELVEVIRGEKTSDETVATVVALAKKIRKTPIVVKDCAGFLVNRVLMPYMNEALLLLQEGVEMGTIDRTAAHFGMPMGPLALTDLVGLGTACYAGKLLAGAYPERAVTSPILEEMLSVGGAEHHSALKFWKSKGRGARPEPSPEVLAIIAKHQKGDRGMSEGEITERMFFPMLLEATRVLEEGIVREPGDVDMGLILGTGFPPFRGGVLRWADTLGAATIVKHLSRYVVLGKRYEPTEILIRMARSGETFYPRPNPGAAS